MSAADESAPASLGSSAALPADGSAFVTTHWSVVLAASDPRSEQSRKALESLCAAYWFPLYAYVRRRGHSPADAEDLTQEFFLHSLEHNWVAKAERQKGRFRSFLLMAMSRFLANEWHKARTLKRGAQVRFVPWPAAEAETRYLQEPADATTPEEAFEKQWALTTLDEVLQSLRTEYERGGKGALFEALKPCLVGSRETQPYAELGAALNLSEGAVKVAVCRLRERYRRCLRTQVAQTVVTPADAEEELRHFFRVLAR